ncbi:hypothetical protein HPP92_011506 [Vanilla planifolia]|uniref:Uncharacterized protein n=1 Tax=Vanilla planifolia TaxID=51239 RepID=A0A835R662_VANPL|nr:hypothetical protein HPP92_011506 [Vanilla planifolia]
MAGNKSAKKHIKKTKEVMLGSSANVINADNRRNEEEIAEEQSIILAVAAQGSKNAQSPKAIQHVRAEYTQNACRNTETTGHEYNQNSESTSEEDQYSNGEKGDVPKHSGEQKFQQNAEMEGVAEYSKGLGPWMLVPR